MKRIRKAQATLNLPTLKLEGGGYSCPINWKKPLRAAPAPRARPTTAPPRASSSRTNTAALSRSPAPNGSTSPRRWNAPTSMPRSSPPPSSTNCCAIPLATPPRKPRQHSKWVNCVTRSASWLVPCPSWWHHTLWAWTRLTRGLPCKAAATVRKPRSRPCRNCSTPANRCNGASSATADSCGCCATQPRSPAPAFSKSIWPICSAASAMPNSPTSGVYCTPAAHPAPARALRRASGNNGAAKASRKALGCAMACATASSRPC